jgi:hypothetical protein
MRCCLVEMIGPSDDGQRTTTVTDQRVKFVKGLCATARLSGARLVRTDQPCHVHAEQHDARHGHTDPLTSTSTGVGGVGRGGSRRCARERTVTSPSGSFCGNTTKVAALLNAAQRVIAG